MRIIYGRRAVYLPNSRRLPTYLFRDEFDTARAAGSVNGTAAEPGPGTRSITDTGVDVSIEDGRLKAAEGTGNYNDPAYWLSSNVRGHIGALSGLVRLAGNSGGGSSDIGPMLLLDPSNAPADPTASSLGVYFFYPQFRIPGLGTAPLTKGSTRVRSIDYLLAVVPRVGGGAYVFISGGVYATFPTGTLLWVYDSGSDDPLYSGWQNHLGVTYLDLLTVLSSAAIFTAFTTRYGPSLAGDTFTRADGSLGSTETGGLSWTVTNGTASISSNKVTFGTITNHPTAWISPASAPHIIKGSITTPSSGRTNCGIVFRRKSDGTFIDWGMDSNASAVQLRTFNGSIYTTIASSAKTINNSTTYRLTVVDWGDRLRCFIDNENLPAQDITSSLINQGETGGGFQRFSSDNGSTFDDFEVWPETISLPEELGPFSEIPGAIDSATVTDAFTNTDGTDLTTHNAAWTQASGTWEVRSNKAQLTAADAVGIAVRETNLTGQEVSASVTTPNTTPTYPTDWYCGVIARYTDANNFLIARFLYQNNNPEIELWEHLGGSATLIGYTNLGASNLAANTAYTLKLAVANAECGVYLGTELVIQATTDLLTGTKAGIGVQSPLSGQPKWDDFAVAPTVDLLAAELGGTLGLAGALIKQTERSLSGTLTSGGGLLKQALKVLAGTFGSSGALTAAKVALKSLEGSLALSGALIKQTGKSLGGGLSSSGSLIRQAGKSLGGSLASVGTLARMTSKVLAGTLSSAGALTKQIGKILSGVLSSAGALVGVISAPVTGIIGLVLSDRSITWTLRSRVITLSIEDRRITWTVKDR